MLRDPTRQRGRRSSDNNARVLDSNAARRARRALDAAGGLVGRGGIARGLQPPVSQPRAHAITTTDGFPAPYARVGNTPVWVVADVATWFAATGRTWTPPTRPVMSADDGTVLTPGQAS
jgi:hypothetical protein